MLQIAGNLYKIVRNLHGRGRDVLYKSDRNLHGRGRDVLHKTGRNLHADKVMRG